MAAGRGSDHGGSIQAARPLRVSTYPSSATQRGDDQAHLLAHASTDSAFEVLTDNKVVNPAIEERGGKSSLIGAQSVASSPPPIQYSEEELRQTDRMFDRMILSYFLCLGLGWGLLFSDWAFNEVEKHPKAEPWINDAVTIGGASAVLSPIIQWGHTIMYTNGKASEVARVRRRFYQVMWLTYVAIVGLSTLVASLRFAMGEDGSLHHFLSTTSSHLVLARISASLINWGAGKLFIRMHRTRLATGPIL